MLKGHLFTKRFASALTAACLLFGLAHEVGARPCKKGFYRRGDNGPCRPRPCPMADQKRNILGTCECIKQGYKVSGLGQCVRDCPRGLIADAQGKCVQPPCIQGMVRVNGQCMVKAQPAPVRGTTGTPPMGVGAAGSGGTTGAPLMGVGAASSGGVKTSTCPPGQKMTYFGCEPIKSVQPCPPGHVRVGIACVMPGQAPPQQGVAQTPAPGGPSQPGLAGAFAKHQRKKTRLSLRGMFSGGGTAEIGTSFGKAFAGDLESGPAGFQIGFQTLVSRYFSMGAGFGLQSLTALPGMDSNLTIDLNLAMFIRFPIPIAGQDWIELYGGLGGGLSMGMLDEFNSLTLEVNPGWNIQPRGGIQVNPLSFLGIFFECGWRHHSNYYSIEEDSNSSLIVTWSDVAINTGVAFTF